MMIDSLGGVPLPGVMDMKIEKKEDVDGIKPIEESGDTSQPGVDIDQDNATRYRTERQKPEEVARVEGYNARGEPVSNYPPQDDITGESSAINVEV